MVRVVSQTSPINGGARTFLHAKRPLMDRALFFGRITATLSPFSTPYYSSPTNLASAKANKKIVTNPVTTGGTNPPKILNTEI